MPGPVRLNPNRMIHEEKMLVKLLRSRLESLDARDAYFVAKRALKIVVPKLFKVIPTEPVRPDTEGLNDDILRTLKENIADGNPNLLRVAMDYEADFRGRQHLDNLTVIITPYEIKDPSLTNIVLNAGRKTVEEVRAALAERDRIDALLLADSREMVHG